MSGFNHFDIIALGGGPSAQKCAIQASKLGKKAAIIEKDSHLGGGCVHWGTIPSKSLQETSRFYRQLSNASFHGLNMLSLNEISMKEMMHRASQVIEREEDVAREQMIEQKVSVLHGWGKILDPNNIEVTSSDGRKKVYSTDYIMIATGSSPRRPDNEGIPFEVGKVYDSDGLFSVEKVPKTIAIVGGGIIGCEYATIFANIGIKVHLIDNADRVLGFLDKEISETLAMYMKKNGLSLHLSEKIIEYKNHPNFVELILSSGHTVKVDQVLISRGRLGNIKNIGLEELGIKCNDRSQILVNEHYQTNIPNIFAGGDVIGFPSLASVSMYQGIYVAKYIFSENKQPHLDAEELPLGVYTLPEVASIGPTEEALQSRGIDYGVGRANFETITRSQISGDTQGLLKLLYEKKSHKLLGVHIISEKATELLALGQSVVGFGGKVDYFLEHIFNYPTLIGAYKNAASDALSQK
jgi:NAD(P) transhydrogenase